MTQKAMFPLNLRSVANLIAATKRRSYDLMNIQPGHKVLDVGCGLGTNKIPLTSLVGEGVQVDVDVVLKGLNTYDASQGAVVD